DKIAHTRIDGIGFEIWHAKDWGDLTGTNKNRWSYIAYRATAKHLSTTLDIRKFLADAIERGLVAREHFVSGVELGNELLGGTGETWVRNLSLDVAVRLTPRSDPRR